MPIIREQAQFKIGPIGVARASESGQIVGEAIANSADQIANMFYKTAATKAEKFGQEQAMSATPDSIITINPKTGEPEAYQAPAGSGTIATDAYQRIISSRFQQSIEDEIQNKGKALAVKYEDSANGTKLYETAMSDYIASMSNAATGQFKGYIQQVGTTYLNATRANMAVAQVRRERAAAAKAHEETISNGLNNVEALVSQLGPNSINGPTQTNAIISSVATSIGDGRDAGILNPSQVNGMNKNLRSATIRGLVRYASSNSSNSESLQLLQYAIGSQNPDMVPAEFSYVADAMRGMGSDFSGMADLEKFSDGLLADRVQYAKIVEDKQAKEIAAEQAVKVFDLKYSGAQAASFETQVASSPMYSASTISSRAASSFSDLTDQARNALATGNSDLSAQIIKNRDEVLGAQAKGLYLRGLQGLSSEQTQLVERAIFEKNPMLAPESARESLIALSSLSNSTGQDLMAGFLPVLGSYREAAGKAISIQLEADAASQASAIDIAGMSRSKDPVTDLGYVLDSLNGIENLDPKLKESLIASAKGNTATAFLNKFLGGNPSEAKFVEAKGLLSTGVFSGNVLTTDEVNQLSAARQYAIEGNSVSELTTQFNTQKTAFTDRRVAIAKVEADNRMLQQISMGAGDSRSPEQRQLVDKDMEARYSQVLSGRTLASIWADPNAVSNPALRPIFDELSESNVMPESLHKSLTSFARGGWLGGDPTALLSNYINLRDYQFEGVAMRNPMVSSLSQSELATLDYLADIAPIAGNQSPELIVRIFNVKNQYDEDPNFKAKVTSFFDGQTPEDVVMSLSGAENLSPSAFNAMTAATLDMYSLTRSESVSSSNLIDRLQKQLDTTYPTGGNYVVSVGGTSRTRFPLSYAVPKNEDLFKDHVMNRVMETNPKIKTWGFGRVNDTSWITGNDTYDGIYLQPLDSSNDGEVRYIVKQVGKPEAGGDMIVHESFTEDGKKFSAPLIISNRDPQFMQKTKARATAKINADERAVLQSREAVGTFTLEGP